MEELRVPKSVFVFSLWGELNQTYTVLKVIGTGYYGNVLLVRHKLTQELRATKRLLKSRIEHIDKLVTEISIMQHCDHPNIVKLYEILENDSHIYLIMEYCEGGDLLDRLQNHTISNEAQAVDITQQVLTGLHYLHMRNICHRDIKPENLMYHNGTVKLIDFGLSKICKQPTMTTKVGTCYYVSPDVLTGQYTVACDVWSLGVFVYLMLSGRFPFYGRSDQETIELVKRGRFDFNSAVWRDISSEAKDLISRMLDTNPTTRITTQECLAHAWLTSAEPQVLLNFELKSYTRFVADMRMRKLVTIFLAFQCAEADILEIKQAFCKLDTDADGLISYEEFKQGLLTIDHLNQEELRETLSRLQLHRDRCIEYTEFIAHLFDVKHHATEERLWAAFKQFDIDNTNMITVDKLIVVLGESFNDTEAGFWEGLIAEVDVNGDGMVRLT
jgi:calcium-dependent protein kinase